MEGLLGRSHSKIYISLEMRMQLEIYMYTYVLEFKTALTLLPSETWTISFPVAGLLVAKVLPDAESTNSLLIKSCSDNRANTTY